MKAIHLVIELTLVLYLLTLTFTFCFATDAPLPCETSLSPLLSRYELAQIQNFKERQKRFSIVHADLLAFSDTPSPFDYFNQAHQDIDTPELYSLEPLNQLQNLPHEIRTARDYARFSSHHQESFIYINSFEKRTIPCFDGIIVTNKTREAIANISFKYSDFQISEELKNIIRTQPINQTHPLYTMIRKSLLNRLNFEQESEHLDNWFLTTNNLVSFSGVLNHKNYKERLRRTKTLTDLFGISLAIPPEHSHARTTRIVIDYRDTGYPFEWFQKLIQETNLSAELIATIKTIKSTSEQKLSIQLLWDDQHVITIE